MSVSKNGKLDSSESFLIYSVVSQGLKILSTCATRVQEQTAFKFAYPANPATLSGVPEDALAYELVKKTVHSAAISLVSPSHTPSVLLHKHRL